MSQRPVVVGLHVCKVVIVDKTTGHVTLVNRVQRIRYASFPTGPEDFKVCCFVADGQGEITFTAQVIDLSGPDAIYSRHWRLPMTKSFGEQRLIITVKDLVFPGPGRYEFLLLADGEWLASGAITVLGKEKT